MPDLKTIENPLVQDENGCYGIDFDDFEQKITDKTRLFLLCNPHNPVGRVFRRDELERMAEICLRKNVLICSDEIHGDLIFPGIPAYSPGIDQPGYCQTDDHTDGPEQNI